ncbi:uncharacterized protein LOC105704257 [Orussus abietinus]|uniref:uncharacterized protein LOC105704257 n=1 Tax=Orussus abietinus TaxID=222816 RepID=UPI0006258019|nr:uncharacterized protein LOC105704257 [Orussus abietinus]
MGNYTSKLLSQYEEQEGKQKMQQRVEPPNENTLSTPTFIKKIIPLDPRSVTIGITRTPIEVNCTPPQLTRKVVSALPKYLQAKKLLETDIDNVILPLTPKKCLDPRSPATSYPRTPILVDPILDSPISTSTEKQESLNGTPITDLRYKILGLDPRSPAADFDRTPILMPKSCELLRARSHEHLRRQGSYDTDVFQSRLSYCETTTSDSIPEIQALPDIATNLQTTFDLNVHDTSKLNELNLSTSSHNSSIETISESGDEVTVIRRSSSMSTLISQKVPETVTHDRMLPDGKSIKTTHDNVSNVLAIAIKSTDRLKCVDSEDKFKVWRDSTSPDIPLELNDNADHVSIAPDIAELQEEIMIEFDDNVILRNSKEVRVRKSDKSEDTKSKAQDSTGKKKKGLKSEKNIKDEKKVFTPEGKNTTETKNRTPLGNRSNKNSQIQGIISKSPQQTLRSKTLPKKLLQENTPPHKTCLTKNKLSGIQWDPDSTVII